MDPLLYIERGLSYPQRKYWGRLLFVWSLLFLSMAITSLTIGLPYIYAVSFEIFFIFFLALYIANALAKFVFLHLYKERLRLKTKPTYEVLVIQEKGRLHKDDVVGFLNTTYGDQIMKRLGVSRISLEDYLAQRNFMSRIDSIGNEMPLFIDLPRFATALHDNDEHFASFLRAQRIRRDDLHHAANFVHNASVMQKENDEIFRRSSLHELTPLEYDVLKIEKSHDVYFTSQSLRKLQELNDDEKMRMIRKILENVKNENRKNIYITDVINHDL